MIAAARVTVGSEPFDLADVADAGTPSGTQLVKVTGLRNRGATDLWLGEVGAGYQLAPGETFPGPLLFGSADSFYLSRAEGEGPVEFVRSWS